MPRTADPDLKDRILDAADRLLRQKGEKGLTVRAVASAARTTTPTVYKRFRNRAALMQALGNRERLRFFERLDKNSTIEETCRWYLEYATDHRHAYQLIYGPYWPQIFASAPGEPAVEWAKASFAKRFGGKPEQYHDVVRWMRMVLHGAGSLLVNAPKGAASKQLKRECLDACNALIAHAKNSRR